APGPWATGPCAAAVADPPRPPAPDRSPVPTSSVRIQVVSVRSPPQPRTPHDREDEQHRDEDRHAGSEDGSAGRRQGGDGEEPHLESGHVHGRRGFAPPTVPRETMPYPVRRVVIEPNSD